MRFGLKVGRGRTGTFCLDIRAPPPPEAISSTVKEKFQWRELDLVLIFNLGHDKNVEM